MKSQGSGIKIKSKGMHKQNYSKIDGLSPKDALLQWLSKKLGKVSQPSCPAED